MLKRVQTDYFDMIDCQPDISNIHKELKDSSKWKKISNLEIYFDFYKYICSKYLMYGTKEFE